MYKFVFLVPKSHLQKVKNAIFKVISSPYDKYDNCCYQNKVIGQFRPLEGSNAFIGEKGSITYVREYKVELLIGDKEELEKVISVMRKVHPYESPAYEAWELSHYGF